MDKNKKYFKCCMMVIVFALIMSIVYVPRTEVNAATKVKRVNITRPKANSLTLKKGAKYKLKVNVYPKKAANKKLLFKSDKKRIATVTSKGVIKAKKTGSAKITVISKANKMKKDSIKVKVINKKTNVSVTNVLTNPQSTAKVSTEPSKTALPVATDNPEAVSYVLEAGGNSAQLYIDGDAKDFEGLKLVADCFADDVKLVTDAKMSVETDQALLTGTPVIAGSIGNNKLIDKLIAENKLDVSQINGKWETYKIAIVNKPIDGIEKALVIAGSDKRGTIYGIFHISELMSVSPWVYWADVNPEKRDTVAFKASEVNVTSKEPSVKYRGIFLNDEEPALGTWVNNFFKESSGGKFNEKFYDNVFQLLLRLKGNYLWPAMWNGKFEGDGIECPEASAVLADKYGIVMGTSHHELMMRAHETWNKTKSTYGNGAWDFVGNREGMTKFFEDGALLNGKYDNIATLGMRGDGDAAMLPETSTLKENIDLLKDIILTQKDILNKNGYGDKPKVIALYKEVEDYWSGDSNTDGLKDWDGLDDVTAMLAEDNYGNLRTLPAEEKRNREAGWGMYYHFDYNGAPASYSWIQTNQIEKVWEQMSMSYDYGIKNIWIVNVGDLKPMEMPISYFMDMAYDFDTWGTDNIASASEYERGWLEEQFGKYVDDEAIDGITSVVNDYLKLSAIKKPEILTGSTYSIAYYNEAAGILDRTGSIIDRAEKYKEMLPEEAQAAYYQLVYYPAVATANLNRIQLYAGLNSDYAKKKSSMASVYAEKMNECIEIDKQLEQTYDKDMPGGVGDKWNGMMAQAINAAHIGYPGWEPKGAYPTASNYLAAINASMQVGLSGDEKIYTTGTAALQAFSSVNNETYNINLTNGGNASYDYTITADKDWIKLSKSKGTVGTEDVIKVNIDFANLDSEKNSGVVTINGNGQSVNVQITANVISTEGLSDMTYVQANGYVSIEAAHYAETKAASNGASWKEIKNYGRTLSSIKVFPTTLSFGIDDSPYVDYKVYITDDGSYKLQSFLAPSNPVNSSNISMKYGISVDGGSAKVVDTISNSYIAGTWKDSLWSNGVRNNMHTLTSDIGQIGEGVHTIRIYAVDPALVFQKFLLYPSDKTPKSSYLGPQESYYTCVENKK